MEPSQECGNGLPTLSCSWRSLTYTTSVYYLTILISPVVRSIPWGNIRTLVQSRCISPYERFDSLSPRRWSNQGNPSDPPGGYRNIQNVSHNVVAVPYAASQTMDGASGRGEGAETGCLPLLCMPRNPAEIVALHYTGQRKPLLNNVILELVSKEYVDSRSEKAEWLTCSSVYILAGSSTSNPSDPLCSLFVSFFYPSSNQCVNAIERSPVFLLHSFLLAFLLFLFCILFLSFFPLLGSVVSFVDRLSSFSFTLLPIILFLSF